MRPQRLHGDVHVGNLLWTPDAGPHFVDLDDACTGPAVQDLWMLLPGERSVSGRALACLLEGYTTFCDFDERELSLIEPLRTVRLIHYSGWLARRWSDPAFPAPPIGTVHLENSITVHRPIAVGETLGVSASVGPARPHPKGRVYDFVTTVTAGATYQYRVVATSVVGDSSASNTVTVALVLPGAPTFSSGTATRQGGGERATLQWADVTGETGYTIQWSSTSAFTTVAGTGTAAANATSFTTGTITRQVWYFRIRATNSVGASAWSPVRTVSAA